VQPSRPLIVTLAACGSIATLSQAVLAYTEARDGTPLHLTLLAVSCAAYLIALVVCWRTRSTAPAWAIWTILALALAMRFPLLFPPTGPGSDIFRYVWDARVQRHGHNPLVVIPSDPKYEGIHTPDTRQMQHTHIPSPYPPAAQLFFRVVTTVSESPRAFKASAAAADLLACLALLGLLRATGRPEWLVVSYAWNPLVVLEGARNGHFDAVGAVLLVSAPLALAKRRSLAATLAFVTAVSLKLLPAVLAPLFWRRIRVRDAAAGAALVAALYWPFLESGVIPIGSLSRVINRYRFNGPAYEWLDDIVGPWAVAWLALAAGLGVAAWLRARCRASAPEAWAWPMAIALMFAPQVYPWYLVWLAPFLTTRWTLPLLVWTITILPVYVVWAFPPGSGWFVPPWLLAIEYGAVAVTAILVKRLSGSFSGTKPTTAEATRRTVAEDITTAG
jgi:alpha-1,6-mannosyltransferase